MKNLKVKSMLFSLLAIMAVAVFLTSCEQESIIVDELDGFVTESSIDEVYDLADLPTSPEDVWAAANAETNTSDLDTTEEELESRGCQRKVRWISRNYVSWNSNPQYALWIYHYNSNGNYIGSTRKDVPYCGTWTKYYSAPSGRCKSVAFVGYQYLGTKTYFGCN